MKTILLGGLESGLAAQITKAFEPFKGDYALQPVGSLGELLVLLETSQGDLLFLDLDTPGGVALEWLARLAEVRSSIPILGTGHAERPDITGYEARFPEHFFPFLTYLRKPIRPEEIVNAVQSEIRHVARGVIEGLSLASLLQMLHMEGKTCTIRVTSGRRQGFFYMRAGQIINARYRRAEGQEAALLLLASTSPKAEIDGQLHDSTQHIHMRIEELMMEAMRLQDEAARDAGAQEDDSGDEAPWEVPATEAGKWETPPQPAAPQPAAPPPAPPPPKPPAKPRRRRYWLIAAAAILPFGAIPFFLPREEQVGVQSSPPGALVRLDGQPQGQTPLQLILPKPLHGLLALELSGYEAQSHALQPGEASLSFTLKPLPPPPEVVPPPPEAAPEPAPAPEKPKKAPAPKPIPKQKKGDVFDQVRQP